MKDFFFFYSNRYYFFYSNRYCLDALNPIDVTGALYRWPKIVAVIAAVHPHSPR